VSSIFYILFSRHYILSRETSNNHPSGYEPHAASSILIRWRTIGRRFIPQTKKSAPLIITR